MEGQMTSRRMIRQQMEARQGRLQTIAKVVGSLVLFVLVVDGVLSLAMGTRWMELQRANTPPWYARIPAALQRLPDPALRAVGAFQAAASVFGLVRLR